MPFSTTLAKNILNAIFAKNNAFSVPQEVYIGLCTNDPEADNGSITELSGSGYARVLISKFSQTYPETISPASGRTISNAYQINWTKATADWERVNGFFLSTSKTVGETSAIYFYGKLDLSEEDEAAGGLLVEEGMIALFDPYSFQISFPASDA